MDTNTVETNPLDVNVPTIRIEPSTFGSVLYEVPLNSTILQIYPERFKDLFITIGKIEINVKAASLPFVCPRDIQVHMRVTYDHDVFNSLTSPVAYSSSKFYFVVNVVDAGWVIRPSKVHRYTRTESLVQINPTRISSDDEHKTDHPTTPTAFSSTPKHMTQSPLFLSSGFVPRQSKTDVFGVTDSKRNVLQIYVCTYAAKCGKLEMLKTFHARNYTWDAKTSASAAGAGHLDVFSWAVDNGCPHDEWTYGVAAANGHMHILEFAHDRGYVIGGMTVSLAIESGNFEIVKWMYEKVGCQEISSLLCYYATLDGRLDIISWARDVHDRDPLFTGFFIDRAVCREVVDGGHLHIAQWLHVNGYPCGGDMCVQAIHRKHVDMFKWIFMNGQLDGDEMTIYYYLCSTEQNELLEWTLERSKDIRINFMYQVIGLNAYRSCKNIKSKYKNIRFADSCTAWIEKINYIDHDFGHLLIHDVVELIKNYA